MIRSSLKYAVLALSALLLSAAAQAQAQTQAPAQAQPQKYEVTGFREARFGMTETEVRNVAGKAFGLKPADLVSGTNAVEGTTVVTAKLTSLDPGPGPARIAYIFGASSKKLIQVNVVWGEEVATPPVDSNAIIAAGTRLQHYFADFGWRKDTTRAGIPVGENTVALFAGDDEKKGAVRLIVDGVKFQLEKDGKPITSPDPKGPPKLIINYIADRETPDVAHIEKGKF
jgi:hypothetical protein